MNESWLNALTLKERIFWARESTLDGASNSQPHQSLPSLWRNQPPFQEEDFFQSRLSADQITEAEFIHALEQHPFLFQGPTSELPGWLIGLDLLYSCREPEHPAFASDPQRISQAGFLQLAAPIVQDVKRRLAERIALLCDKHPEGPRVRQPVELFAKRLDRQLLGIVTRTLVLELNVRRIQGLLVGESAEQRFQSYVEQLAQPHVRSALMKEYPVLGRAMWVCAQRWLRFSTEMVEHFHSDWQVLARHFKHNFSGDDLIDIILGAGDAHRGGRSVSVLVFASGFRLVYKPRSLGVDLHFNDLLHWCNQQKIELPFRLPEVLDRGTHGWMEHVAGKEPQSTTQLEHFYHRLGAMLALLHALHANDCHFENVIADGEDPIFVDLETLFHPKLELSAKTPALAFVSAISQRTVLRVGLLPQRLAIRGGADGIDISGIGGTGDQLTPHEVLTNEFSGTDQMRLVRKRLKMDGGQNRPRLAGREVDPIAYTAQITAGFREIYDLLARHREELTARDGLLERFGNDHTRVVIRPTRIYGRVLTESYHPNLLRNGLDRDRFLDRLWVTVRKHPEISTIITAEQADLRGGDVPLFLTKPGSRDLWTSAGNKISNYFNTPALQVVRRSWRGFCGEDRERQVCLIKASLAAASPASPERKMPPEQLAMSPAAGTAQLLDAAQSIADLLIQSAYSDDRYAVWIGPKLVGPVWTVEAGNGDLYGGGLGIALFLAYCGEQFNQTKYRTVARKALRHSLDRFWEELPKSSHKLLTGGFAGSAGLIYVLTKLSRLWNEPDLCGQALRIGDALVPGIEQDKGLNIADGNAGLLCALSALYRATSSSKIKTAARMCADYLVRNATHTGHGVGWITPSAARPLTGFAHGAAGIAHSLFCFASIESDLRYLQTAAAAIEYETSQKLSSGKNWRDLRDHVVEEEVGCMGWCHGAPGIGLSRIAASRFLGDDVLEHDVTMAIQAIMEYGLDENNCVCHGNLGLLNFLFEAAWHRNDVGLEDYARRCCRTILDITAKEGWICDAPGRSEVHGFMPGLSGVGYSLLRFASPDRVPCVLLLE